MPKYYRGRHGCTEKKLKHCISKQTSILRHYKTLATLNSICIQFTIRNAMLIAQMENSKRHNSGTEVDIDTVQTPFFIARWPLWDALNRSSPPPLEVGQTRKVPCPQKLWGGHDLCSNEPNFLKICTSKRTWILCRLKSLATFSISGIRLRREQLQFRLGGLVPVRGALFRNGFAPFIGTGTCHQMAYKKSSICKPLPSKLNFIEKLEPLSTENRSKWAWQSWALVNRCQENWVLREHSTHLNHKPEVGVARCRHFWVGVPEYCRVWGSSYEENRHRFVGILPFRGSFVQKPSAFCRQHRESSNAISKAELLQTVAEKIEF